MTYQQALAFVEETKKYGSILGLDSIRALMKELGDVQEDLSIIHIAGTNGKGSVGAMLQAVLEEAGLKVGRYSSPAVFSYREIWQINGKAVSEEAYAALMEKIKTACLTLTEKGLPHPTSFEVETAAAFLYFKEEACDVVLLETGMGGREDATNLITHPICSVITSISMDHMQFLGNTLSEIASAKAGIIKENCPVVSAWQEDAVKEILVKEAERLKAQLYQPKKDAIRNLLYDMKGMQFDYVREDNSQWKIRLPLTGAYQAANAACALKVIEVLKEKTFPQFTLSVIQNGFQKVCWNGRFEHVLEEPLCILDGAHNEGAALQLAKTLENCFTNRKITYIIGVLADKAHEKILKIMRPYSETVYAVTPHNGRALPAEKLAEEAKAAGYQTVITEPLIEDAVRHAIAESSGEDVVLIFGSLSYLAEAKQAVIQYREGQKNDR